jgi:hypothetical protein
MLAEIRSLGEGIIISDQSPQKLARDAIRNTNVQIAHQLRDGDDRDAIARAMIMEDEQRDYLGKLGKGSAALFRTGLEKATFVQVASYAARPGDRGHGMNPGLSDDEVQSHMRVSGLFRGHEPERPLPGCAFCRTPLCVARSRVRRRRQRLGACACPGVDVASRSEETCRKPVSPSRRSGTDTSPMLCANSASKLRSSLTRDAGWCHFAHGWHFGAQTRKLAPRDAQLISAHREKFAASFARVRLAAHEKTDLP